MSAVEAQLIVVHQDAIVDKGVDALLDEVRVNEARLVDLRRMYQLFGRVEAHSLLKDAYTSYIKRRGKDIVLNKERDKTMVEDILSFKSLIDRTVAESFGGSELFVQAVREGFEYFVNQRHNKPAEMIAKYFDTKLRTGYKECSEERLDALFDRVMIIFRYVNGKDVFEAFYKTNLARRLLLQKSASDDAERSILSKLKQECGAAFTGKLEGMFKDVNLSQDLTNSFRQTIGQKAQPEVDLYVNVLTASNWPTAKAATITLPAQIEKIQSAFSAFYCSKHANRKLTWENSKGHCLIEGRFPKGTKDLQLSSYQGVVLLLFNAEDSLTCLEAQQRSKIGIPELKRVLQSLACGKVRVLTKNPKGREVADSDSFTVNTKFENKHRRVKINQIQLRETSEENSQTQAKIFQDRIFAVDAAIVRIMKTRKTLKHNMLLAALFEQLRFPAKASDLKKRIERYGAVRSLSLSRPARLLVVRLFRAGVNGRAMWFRGRLALSGWHADTGGLVVGWPLLSSLFVRSLINRDYMERDANDSQLYTYLA